ncbi:hypothetical protein SARC_16156, partial [Sphaeroforma arctica JP610]
SEEKRIIELLQKHNEKFINIAINYNEYREQPMLHEGFGAVDVLHDTTEFREESLKRKCEGKYASVHTTQVVSIS